MTDTFPPAYITSTGKSPSVWRPLLRLLIPWSIFILMMSVLLYERLWEFSITPYKQKSQAALTEAVRSISQNVGDLRRDVLFLARHANEEKNELAPFFQGFSDASGKYAQLRLIDDRGIEKLRVDYKGKAQIIKQELLQDKSNRFYVKAGMQLEKGEIYFSPLDLNVEHGEIEKPINPMIRVVTPIFNDGGKKEGLVVINFFAQPMLDELRKLVTLFDTDIALINREGYWLLNSQSEKEWGFMYEKPQWTLGYSNPDVWKKMISTKNGELINSEGYWIFQTLDTRRSGVSEDVWKLLVHVNQLKLGEIRSKALGLSITAGLLVLLLASFVAWRLARSVYDKDIANTALNNERLALKQANISLESSLDKLKTAQQDLIQAEKLSSLGMMVAGVAHELNTPVGASLLTVSSLLDKRQQFGNAMIDGLRVSDLERYFKSFDIGIEIINKNLSRSAELVKTFKRLAIDRTQEERRQFRLNDLVDDLQHTTWIHYKKTAHKIIINIDEDIELDSYPGALGRVLENLVNNAFMHGFADGQGSQLCIHAKLITSEELCIEIVDNGCGMEPSILKSIFDPFFTTGRSKGGTGLGLHIVHHLVTQLLEGSITVKSTLKEGTRMILHFPVKVKS